MRKLPQYNCQLYRTGNKTRAGEGRKVREEPISVQQRTRGKWVIYKADLQGPLAEQVQRERDILTQGGIVMEIGNQVHDRNMVGRVFAVFEQQKC